MNIQSRLRLSSAEGYRLKQGVSLLRGSYDHELIVRCALLKERLPEANINSSHEGRNRLAINMLVTGDIRRSSQRVRVLGGLSVRRAMDRLLNDVPTLAKPRTFTVANLQIHEDTRKANRSRYLKAVFDDESATQLQAEVDGIRSSLESWAKEEEPPFIWERTVPSHLSLAAVDSNAEALERVAHELWQPPFPIELGAAQLILANAVRKP